MRKPIEAEVRGLRTPRERIWASIRALKKNFAAADVQDGCNPMVLISAVNDYLVELERAGFVKRVGRGAQVKGRSSCITTGVHYDQARDQFEAPRLNKGKAVTAGVGVLAMWRAMKVLKSFDYHAVAHAASQGDFIVKDSTAKSYVQVLARAGYFHTLREAKPGTPALFRLAKNTGPHAPAITRRKAVFDRNTGQFAELETAQEVCDALDE